MSERLNDSLSKAADFAACAAREPGAAAARKRGRKRRNHQRLAASALSLALLGGVGGIAAVSVGHGGGAPVANSTASASPTVSVEPSISASPSTSLSSTPTPSATGTRTAPTVPASGPAGTTTQGGSGNGTSQSSPTVTDPDTYVAGAWLAAGQLPLAQPGVTTWDPDQSGVGTKLGGNVYEQTAAFYKSSTGIGSCTMTRTGSGVANALGEGLNGVQYEGFQGSNYNKALPNKTIPYVAGEESLFYGSADKARTAFAALPEGYANCKGEISGVDPTTGETVTAQIRQTLDTATAQCWSILVGGAIDHDCYVRSGTLVEMTYLEINEVTSFSAYDFGSIDDTDVSQLQQALEAYAQAG